MTDATRLAAIRQEWADDTARCCDTWQDDGWEEHHCAICGKSEMTHEMRVVLVALETAIGARQQAEQEASRLQSARIGDAEIIGRWQCQAEAAEQQVTALAEELETERMQAAAHDYLYIQVNALYALFVEDDKLIPVALPPWDSTCWDEPISNTEHPGSNQVLEKTT